MLILFSILVAKKAPKPIVTDANNHFIPMPKGFTSGFIRTTDDGRLVVEQENKKALVWVPGLKDWREADEPEHSCRSCGHTHQGLCPLNVPGCPLNKEHHHG